MSDVCTDVLVYLLQIREELQRLIKHPVQLASQEVENTDLEDGGRLLISTVSGSSASAHTVSWSLTCLRGNTVETL